jgi:hypothetical protein
VSIPIRRSLTTEHQYIATHDTLQKLTEIVIFGVHGCGWWTRGEMTEEDVVNGYRLGFEGEK